MEIDGTTQEGFDPTTRQPLIGLNGQQAGASANGLSITSTEVTVRGLAIYNFTRNGIYIQTGRGSEAARNEIVGNYIGTDITGERDFLGNGIDGVSIQDSANNTIGGTTAADRNVISGNGSSGVAIEHSSFQPDKDARGNEVSGNYIGTDKDGEQDLGNDLDGVFILDGSGNRVGGATEARRNVISGNEEGGVLITGGDASGNEVSANYIVHLQTRQ